MDAQVNLRGLSFVALGQEFLEGEHEVVAVARGEVTPCLRDPNDWLAALHLFACDSVIWKPLQVDRSRVGIGEVVKPVAAPQTSGCLVFGMFVWGIGKLRHAKQLVYPTLPPVPPGAGTNRRAAEFMQ